MRVQEKARFSVTVGVPDPGKISDLYGIVLAAGNGRRMEDFICHFYGCRQPKQYVAFTGKRSMIQHTLGRVRKLIPREKILVVVDPRHQKEIDTQLGDCPGNTLIFQPINRETAPGILLPSAHIYKEDPESTVAIFPSDHFVLEEERFMGYIRFAKKVNQLFPEKVILLGVQPDAPEVEYGWIQPGEKVLGLNGIEISHVKGFHEKPDTASALHYYNVGYLWNTLVIVARCSTLWRLASKALPKIQGHFKKIMKALGTPEEQKVIMKEYQEMDQATFSHAVLEKYPSRLLVMTVKEVFWSDWGNGPRVLETLKKIGRPPKEAEPSVS